MPNELFILVILRCTNRTPPKSRYEIGNFLRKLFFCVERIRERLERGKMKLLLYLYCAAGSQFLFKYLSLYYYVTRGK